MDFLEIKKKIEDSINSKFSFELLELHYVPYAFGSGTLAYRIKGYVVIVHYDGKDGFASVRTSSGHSKYPVEGTEIFHEKIGAFFDKGWQDLLEQIGS